MSTKYTTVTSHVINLYFNQAINCQMAQKNLHYHFRHC